ncbi:MAG: spore germination protein, partial [Bacillota bacterium]|nr:spore germination protein [Bacillota bacterium]
EISVAETVEKNEEILTKLFVNVDILRKRYIESSQGKTQKYFIAYFDGVVNSEIMNDFIIKPLMLSSVVQGSDPVETVIRQIVMINEVGKAYDYEKITEAITYGDTVLFIDGVDCALILNTKGFSLRAIGEPEGEKVISGPREGFTESILINLSMIHRKARTNELKVKFLTLGRRTKTQACVCYMEGIADKRIIKEVFRRLGEIDMDGVLDSNYITELIKDQPYSPFRSTGYTERPDVVIGKLLEGRVAIVLDGTPAVLTVPYLFIENFQSNEDYYLNFYYTSFQRILRILAFFITVLLPGLYVGMAGYHHEVMPTPFMISIMGERSSVPFPAYIEAFFMLLLFDILRETGIRMPSTIGQALSIVGALVIGQAAVEAKIVASPMIIIVATTGITSLLIQKVNAPMIYARTLILFLSATFGYYGTALGISAVLIHMLNLKSFGISQISLDGKMTFQEGKDIVIRAPWWKMVTRPRQIGVNRIRMRERDE